VNVLLLIGKSSTSHEAVAAEASELRAQGHRVTLGTRVPPRQVLSDAVDEVVLLTPALPAPPAPAAPAPVEPAAAAQPVDPTAEVPAPATTSAPVATTPAAGGNPASKVVRTARKRVRWARAQVSGAITEPARSWKAVKRNDTVMALARAADVVVAVDAPMVRAGWQLGKALPLPDGPEVVYGLPAAASAIARKAAR
jgi:hypothetical protein